MKTELNDDQVTFYREMLVQHVDEKATGKCKVCGVSCCETFIKAYDTLAAAGKTMGDPAKWAEEDRTNGADRSTSAGWSRRVD